MNEFKWYKKKTYGGVRQWAAEMARERKKSKREIKKKSTSGFLCVSGETGKDRWTGWRRDKFRFHWTSLSLTHALSLHTDWFILNKTEIPKWKRGMRADDSGLLSPTLQHIARQPNGRIKRAEGAEGEAAIKMNHLEWRAHKSPLSFGVTSVGTDVHVQRVRASQDSPDWNPNTA